MSNVLLDDSPASSSATIFDPAGDCGPGGYGCVVRQPSQDSQTNLKSVVCLDRDGVRAATSSSSTLNAHYRKLS
jgi:hypothetical protein